MGTLPPSPLPGCLASRPLAVRIRLPPRRLRLLLLANDDDDDNASDPYASSDLCLCPRPRGPDLRPARRRNSQGRPPSPVLPRHRPREHRRGRLGTAGIHPGGHRRPRLRHPRRIRATPAGARLTGRRSLADLHV